MMHSPHKSSHTALPYMKVRKPGLIIKSIDIGDSDPVLLGIGLKPNSASYFQP